MSAKGNITASGDSASRRVVKLVDVPSDRIVQAALQSQNFIRDHSASKGLGVYNAVAYWLEGAGTFWVYQTKTSTVVRWFGDAK